MTATFKQFVRHIDLNEDSGLDEGIIDYAKERLQKMKDARDTKRSQAVIDLWKKRKELEKEREAAKAKLAAAKTGETQPTVGVDGKPVTAKPGSAASAKAGERAWIQQLLDQQEEEKKKQEEKK